jgi:hypothetical protein
MIEMADYPLFKAAIKKNTVIHDALDSIAKNKKVIMTIDIEFQQYRIKGNTTYFIREFAAIIFKKKGDIWEHTENIFVNFPYLDKRSGWASKLEFPPYMTMDEDDMTFHKVNELKNQVYTDLNLHNNPLKKYLQESINEIGLNKMELYILYKSLNFRRIKNEIQYLSNDPKHKKERTYSKIRSKQHAIFTDRLKPYELKNFNQIKYLYSNNSAVKTRTIKDPKKFMINLVKQMENAVVIHKGTSDIDAMNNHYMLLAKTNNKIKFNSYDIENYNVFSRILFDGKANLEATFEGLKDKEIIEPDTLLSKFEEFYKGKAHNPLMDAFFALIVSIKMETILKNKVVRQLYNKISNVANK